MPHIDGKSHVPNPKKRYKDDETFKGKDKRVIMKSFREAKKQESFERRKNKNQDKPTKGKYDKSRSYRAPKTKGDYVPAVELKKVTETKKRKDWAEQKEPLSPYELSSEGNLDSSGKAGEIETVSKKRTPSRWDPSTASDRAREITGSGSDGKTAAESMKSKKFVRRKGSKGKIHAKGTVKRKTFDYGEASKTGKPEKTVEKFEIGTGRRPKHDKYDPSKATPKTKLDWQGKAEKPSLHDEMRAEGYKKASSLAEKRRKKHEKDGKDPKSKYGGFDVTVKTKTKGTGDTAKSKYKYKVKRRKKDTKKGDTYYRQ